MQASSANFVAVGVDRDLGLIRLRRVARYSAGWIWSGAKRSRKQFEPGFGRFLAKNLADVAVRVGSDIGGTPRRRSRAMP